MFKGVKFNLLEIHHVINQVEWINGKFIWCKEKHLLHHSKELFMLMAACY